MKITTRELILTSLFTAITAVAAQISIPLPFTTVPFTLQVLAVFLAGGILGWRLGALSQIIYLLLGACGAPVFSLMRGGIGMLAGATGGYLLSYPFAAALIGWILSKKSNFFTSLLANTGALLIIYIVGTTQLKFVANYSWDAAYMAGVIPFIPFDLAKAVMASMVTMSVLRSLRNNQLTVSSQKQP